VRENELMDKNNRPIKTIWTRKPSQGRSNQDLNSDYKYGL